MFAFRALFLHNVSRMKKGVRFFSGHAKSSALVASLVLHAVILVAAVSFVAVKVMVKGEKTFESMRVNRPFAVCFK